MQLKPRLISELIHTNVNFTLNWIKLLLNPKEVFIKKPFFLFPEQEDLQAATSRTSVGSLPCSPH